MEIWSHKTLAKLLKKLNLFIVLSQTQDPHHTS